MINWILFQYHSGCRPGETRLIRLRDCEIERLEDGKVKGIIKIPVNTKTGGRFMIMNGYTLQRVISHLEKGAKLAGIEITPDDFLMLNPFSNDRTPYRDESIRKKFNQILQKASFEKRYTLYSLRSTHISHALLQPGAGSDIYKIAKNCGTSYQMIEQTYDGLSNLVNKGDLGFFQSRKKEDVLMN
jgi:integrase